MNLKHKWLAAGGSLLTLVGLAGCNDENSGLVGGPPGAPEIEEPIYTLVVTPKNTTLPLGLNKQLKASAVLDDNRVIDVTSREEVMWSSSDESIATVNDGEVSGVSVGEVTITASGAKDGQEYADSATVAITDAILDSVVVTPATASTAVGFSTQFEAQAEFSDGSVQSAPEVTFTWSSSEGVSVDEEGNATGLAVGDATITAQTTINGITESGAATLTVTDAAISGLDVSPDTTSTIVGVARQFEVQSVLSDGSVEQWPEEEEVTWTIENEDGGADPVASVDENGLVTPLTAGVATVTASSSEYTDTATLTVLDAVITNLEVAPKGRIISAGDVVSYKAIATLSDGTENVDVTDSDSITWESTNSAVAFISGDEEGVSAEGLSEGSTDIVATVSGSGVSDASLLRVANLPGASGLISIEISIDPDSVPEDALDENTIRDFDYLSPEDASRQLVAMGTYEGESAPRDITDEVTWNVDAPSDEVVNINKEGIVTNGSVSNDTAIVTASVGNVDSNELPIYACITLAGPCVDLFEYEEGKVAVNPPSDKFMERIGAQEVVDGYRTEGGGIFVLEYIDGVNPPFDISPLEAVCYVYSDIGLGGGTDWSLSQGRDSGKILDLAFNSEFDSRGWPTEVTSWSNYLGESEKEGIRLSTLGLNADDISGEIIFLNDVEAAYYRYVVCFSGLE